MPAMFWGRSKIAPLNRPGKARNTTTFEIISLVLGVKWRCVGTAQRGPRFGHNFKWN